MNIHKELINAEALLKLKNLKVEYATKIISELKTSSNAEEIINSLNITYEKLLDILSNPDANIGMYDETLDTINKIKSLKKF